MGAGLMGDLYGEVRQYFELPDQDIRTYSPLALAFMGDDVYDIIIRSLVVSRGNRQPNRLHQKASAMVKAQKQAAMIEALLPELSPEEEGVYRRGRNAKSYTTAKNASISDYRKATGFEALMGYLYLSGRFDRCMELTRRGLFLTETDRTGRGGETLQLQGMDPTPVI